MVRTIISCAAGARGVLRVAADEAGSPTVEFALAAPVLLLVVAAIIEFGMIMFVTVLMEGGLREAARYGITGQIPAGGDRAGQILDIVADRTLGLVDVNKATISITAFPTFDDVGKGEDFVDGNKNEKYDFGETFKDCNGNGKRDESRGKSDAGGGGDVVVYRFDYDWPMLLVDEAVDRQGRQVSPAGQRGGAQRTLGWQRPRQGARELQPVSAVRRLLTFRSDRRASVSVELALTLPMLTALLMGGVEITNYVLVHQKVERTSATIADLVAQSARMTKSEMASLFAATGYVMKPLQLGTDGNVVVSSITGSKDAPIISWQEPSRLGGNPSRFGKEGGQATLPAGLTLRDGENIIAGEVFYTLSADVVLRGRRGDDALPLHLLPPALRQARSHPPVAHTLAALFPLPAGEGDYVASA